MRKTIRTLVIASVIFLVGCAAILTPKFDENEYLLLSRLETHARMLHDECSNPDQVRTRIHQLVEDAEILTTYTFYIPRNTEVFEISKILRDDTREFEKRYADGKTPSITYCKLKAQTFIDKVRSTLEAVGQKQK